MGVNKSIGGAWTKIEEASTGDTFTIQPLYSDVFYCVSASVPDKSFTGGIIPKKEQLRFKKASGDLYLKDADGLGHTLVFIDIVEA
jgi:hypothetical protein